MRDLPKRELLWWTIVVTETLSSPSTAVRTSSEKTAFYFTKDFMQTITNEYTQGFADAGLTLVRGWDDTIASQLTSLSLEDEIKTFTPRDAAERFVSIESARRWYGQKEHVVYTLRDQNDKVGGLLWFSYEPKEGADYTIGIRMYEGLRGKGLAGTLMDACHADFHVIHPQTKGVWLETDETNTRARALYVKHGYKELYSQNGRCFMVYWYA